MKKYKNIIKKISFLFTCLFVLILAGKISNPKVGKIPETENSIDILVIGSGPAGLSAAIQGSRARLKTLIIEGHNPGGQLMGTTWVENFPGHSPQILGPDLIKNLRQQAKNFGSKFFTDSVKKIDFSCSPYKVFTKNDTIFYAKTIVIATGVSSTDLNVKGEKEYYAKGVSHCAISEGPLYKDKDVVIVGGGDSAIEDAMQLSTYARKITILVRGKKMRAIKSSQNKLKNFPNIFARNNTSLKEIIGNETHVTAVRLIDNITGDIYNLKTSGVFLAVGNEPNTKFLNDTLELDENGYIIVKGATQETSMPGVFAAGDVTSEKVHLASVAAGCGTQAGFEAIKFLVDVEKVSENKNFDYIVCFCKGVRYSEIIKAIKEGCSTFEDLHQKLGVCSGCRSCKKEIESILKKELEK